MDLLVENRSALAAFSRLLVFVFVDRNRVQIFRFEDLATVQTADIVDAIPAVEKLGSLVLTSLHSEIKPILD
jgi:hypothetical protein